MAAVESRRRVGGTGGCFDCTLIASHLDGEHEFTYVMQWNIGIAPKWLIISTLALVLTLAVYELLIRQVNGIRWLFGMKPRQRTP